MTCSASETFPSNVLSDFFERALRARACFLVFFEVDLDETDLRAGFFCEVDPFKVNLRTRGCEVVDFLHFAIDDDVVVALRLAGNLIGVLFGAVCFLIGVLGGPKRNGGGACNPIARAPPSVEPSLRQSLSPT